MDRLEQLRQAVDAILRRQPDAEEGRCGFVHLYGVSDVCALLALRRGLDPQLAATAGMLHDIWTYKMADCREHGPLSAREAEGMLGELGYTREEIAQVSQAIANHSAKDRVDGELDELLKDADVLQHYLYNPALGVHSPANPRLQRVFRELSVRI